MKIFERASMMIGSRLFRAGKTLLLAVILGMFFVSPLAAQPTGGRQGKAAKEGKAKSQQLSDLEPFDPNVPPPLPTDNRQPAFGPNLWRSISEWRLLIPFVFSDQDGTSHELKLAVGLTPNGWPGSKCAQSLVFVDGTDSRNPRHLLTWPKNQIVPLEEGEFTRVQRLVPDYQKGLLLVCVAVTEELPEHRGWKIKRNQWVTLDMKQFPDMKIVARVDGLGSNAMIRDGRIIIADAENKVLNRIAAPQEQQEATGKKRSKKSVPQPLLEARSLDKEDPYKSIYESRMDRFSIDARMHEISGKLDVTKYAFAATSGCTPTPDIRPKVSVIVANGKSAPWIQTQINEMNKVGTYYNIQYHGNSASFLQLQSLASASNRKPHIIIVVGHGFRLEVNYWNFLRDQDGNPILDENNKPRKDESSDRVIAYIYGLMSGQPNTWEKTIPNTFGEPLWGDNIIISNPQKYTYLPSQLPQSLNCDLLILATCYSDRIYDEWKPSIQGVTTNRPMVVVMNPNYPNTNAAFGKIIINAAMQSLSFSLWQQRNSPSNISGIANAFITTYNNYANGSRPRRGNVRLLFANQQ